MSVSESVQARRLDTQATLDRTSEQLASALLSLASGPRLTESFASFADVRRLDPSESTTPNQDVVELVLRSISRKVSSVKFSIFRSIEGRPLLFEPLGIYTARPPAI